MSNLTFYERYDKGGLNLTLNDKQVILNKELHKDMMKRGIFDFMFCSDGDVWGLIGTEKSNRSYSLNTKKAQTNVHKPNSMRHITFGKYLVEWNGEFYAVVEKIK